MCETAAAKGPTHIENYEGKHLAQLKSHVYQLHLKWTGNKGSGTSTYTAYSRDHQISAGSKAVLPLSSDPMFRGSPERYSPEELLVASLSSCHMLWFLHLCANAGLTITDYTDEPIGQMRENQDGSGEFTEVILRPSVTFLQTDRAAELEAIHHRAHELCFIARSVNFPVVVEPVQSQ